MTKAASASAVLDVRPQDVPLFRGDTHGVASDEVGLVSLSVELVWPPSAPAPSATGFLSVLSEASVNRR